MRLACLLLATGGTRIRKARFSEAVGITEETAFRIVDLDGLVQVGRVEPNRQLLADPFVKHRVPVAVTVHVDRAVRLARRDGNGREHPERTLCHAGITDDGRRLGDRCIERLRKAATVGGFRGAV
ncbi:hypothetical protein D3C80_1136470 [compost metagenome]